MKQQNKGILGVSGAVCEYPWATVAPGSVQVLTGQRPALGKNRKTHPRSEEKRDEEGLKNSRKLRWQRMREAQRISQDERFQKCHWVPIGFTVKIKKFDSEHPTYFSSVETCSRVWLCPVCSAKITDGRQKELALAAINASMLGLNIYMIVYTVRHKKEHKVKKVLELMMAATSRLKAKRFWARMIKKYQIAGSCTALETTFSEKNGAHIHKHILEFCWRKLNDDEIKEWRDEISSEYQKILSALGGSADAPYDVNIISGNQYIAEYIAKFGKNPKDEKLAVRAISYEMTKLPNKNKSQKEGHYTPWGLIDLSMTGDDKIAKWARWMFREYEKAFFRKAQLTWSKGMAELLGLPERKTDEQLAGEELPKYVTFAEMRRESFKKARLIPAEITEQARTMDFESFAKWAMDEKGIVIETPIIELVSEWDKDDKKNKKFR